MKNTLIIMINRIIKSSPKKRNKKIKRRFSNGYSENGYTVNGRVWISKGGATFLGYGRVTLLERIIDFGSITKAAKSMGMSYRNAWELVDSMNKQADKPLVDLYTGGKGGGGAVVTGHGKEAIALFWKLRSDLMIFFQDKKKELSL